MTRPGRSAHLAVSGCTAIVMVLAIGGIANADVGIAGFSPASAVPGDAVTVRLDGCTYPAAEVRIALARMSATEELVDTDEAVEVEAKDAGPAGEYLVTIPELDPGLYGVLAACPRDATFGFWGSEEYLSVRGAPDTATLAPAAPPVVDAGPWQGLALLASAMLAMVAWSRRRTAGRRG